MTSPGQYSRLMPTTYYTTMDDAALAWAMQEDLRLDAAADEDRLLALALGAEADEDHLRALDTAADEDYLLALALDEENRALRGAPNPLTELELGAVLECDGRLYFGCPHRCGRTIEVLTTEVNCAQFVCGLAGPHASQEESARVAAQDPLHRGCAQAFRLVPAGGGTFRAETRAHG